MPQTLAAIVSSNRTIAAIFVIAFLFAIFPFAESMILHYPDERHYSQGAALMMESGDYLTPRTGEDEVRLKKPPFAYWMSVAGMEIFGIGVIGSRIFWLLGAAAILFVTYRMAKRLTGDDEVALFSLAMLAGNFVFLRSAVTAIPDIPLTLFMLIALYGFAGLLFADEEDRWDAWLAYGGTAMAILTKGIPALAPPACVFGLVILFPSCRRHLRRLVAPLPILFSAVLAGWWFVYQVLRSSSALDNQFVGDQVRSKVEFSVMAVFDSVGLSLAGLLLPLIGWLFVIGATAISTRRLPDVRRLGASALLLSGWIALNIAMFAPAIKPDHRYIIPSLPALSILMAVALTSLDRETASRYLSVFLKFSAIGLALAFAALYGVSAQLLNAKVTVAIVVVIGIGLLLVWRIARRQVFAPMVLTIAALPMAILPAIYPVVAAFGMPDLGKPISDALAKLGHPPDDVLFVGADIVASEARLHSGTERPFLQRSQLGDKDPDESYAVIVTLRRSEADLLAKQGYRIEEVSGGWRNIAPRILLNAVLNGSLAETKAREAERAYIAVNADQ
jgi:4-amino-4-deoxy-L-arabinose transferase-like glycosyltransferase